MNADKLIKMHQEMTQNLHFEVTKIADKQEDCIAKSDKLWEKRMSFLGRLVRVFHFITKGINIKQRALDAKATQLGIDKDKLNAYLR